MRTYKIFLAVAALILLAVPALASEYFYKANKDLKRIGLNEIQKMGSIVYEKGNYRLPPDFCLGYGDALTVSLTGKLEALHEVSIDRDGNATIPLVGTVKVVNMTMDQARLAVKEQVDKRYSNVEVYLSLASVQDIIVTVLGNVVTPDTYAVSPFSRIIDAVAKSGGPTNEGSLIDIRLIRDGKQITAFNTYDFLFKGEESRNIRLKHGDTIFVPARKKYIAVRGNIMRPGIYEAADGSTLKSMIADIVDGTAHPELGRKVYILRFNPESDSLEIFKEMDFKQSEGIKSEDDVVFRDEDTIVVANASDHLIFRDKTNIIISHVPSAVATSERIFKTVHLLGEIKAPGDYFVKENNETLRFLLKKAGGLKDTAFAEGTVFTRVSIQEKEKSILELLTMAEKRSILEERSRLAESILTEEEKEIRQRSIECRQKALDAMASRTATGRIIIDLKEVINGNSDMFLEDGDSIYIPPVPEWVLVSGAVYNPASITFKEAKPIEYYLNAVGGLTRVADREGIYVIKANGITESKSTGYSKISKGDIIIVPENRELSETKKR